MRVFLQYIFKDDEVVTGSNETYLFRPVFHLACYAGFWVKSGPASKLSRWHMWNTWSAYWNLGHCGPDFSRPFLVYQHIKRIVDETIIKLMLMQICRRQCSDFVRDQFYLIREKEKHPLEERMPTIFCPVLRPGCRLLCLLLFRPMEQFNDGLNTESNAFGLAWKDRRVGYFQPSNNSTQILGCQEKNLKEDAPPPKW